MTESGAGGIGGSGEPSYQHIIVPLDGSRLAEQILPHVESLARQFRSTVTLLQVIPSVEEVVTQSMAATGMGLRPGAVPVSSGGAGVDPQPVIEANRHDAEAYLSTIAGRLAAQGIEVAHEQPQGPEADTIVRRAQDMRAALIAMTTHGHGGLRRMVFGSVADSVLRNAPCPVLLVRVTEPGADES